MFFEIQESQEKDKAGCWGRILFWGGMICAAGPTIQEAISNDVLDALSLNNIEVFYPSAFWFFWETLKARMMFKDE